MGKLKPTEKLILMYIKNNNKCIVGTRELANNINIDISNLRRYLKSMESKKIIHMIKSGNRLEVIK
jgi:DNA-binding MarR family transcriptional regulator